MTIMRTTAGINKEQAPAQRTANELHRCFAAGLADEARPAISDFVTGSARRPCGTEVQ